MTRVPFQFEKWKDGDDGTLRFLSIPHDQMVIRREGEVNEKGMRAEG
jgi:hypothetical protein